MRTISRVVAPEAPCVLQALTVLHCEYNKRIYYVRKIKINTTSNLHVELSVLKSTWNAICWFIFNKYVLIIVAKMTGMERVNAVNTKQPSFSSLVIHCCYLPGLNPPLSSAIITCHRQRVFFVVSHCLNLIPHWYTSDIAFHFWSSHSHKTMAFLWLMICLETGAFRGWLMLLFWRRNRI